MNIMRLIRASAVTVALCASAVLAGLTQPVFSDDQVNGAMSAVKGFVARQAGFGHGDYEKIGLQFTAASVPGKDCLQSSGVIDELPYNFICWTRGMTTAAGKPFRLWLIPGDAHNNPDFDAKECDHISADKWLCFDRDVVVGGVSRRVLSGCGDVGQAPCTYKPQDCGAYGPCAPMMASQPRCKSEDMFIFHGQCLKMDHNGNMTCPHRTGRHLSTPPAGTPPQFVNLLGEADNIMRNGGVYFEIYYERNVRLGARVITAPQIRELTYTEFLNEYSLFVRTYIANHPRPPGVTDAELTETDILQPAIWVRIRSPENVARENPPFMRVLGRDGYIYRYALTREAIDADQYWEPRAGSNRNGALTVHYAFNTEQVTAFTVFTALEQLHDLTAQNATAARRHINNEAELPILLPRLTLFTAEAARNAVVQRLALSLVLPLTPEAVQHHMPIWAAAPGVLAELFQNYRAIVTHPENNLVLWGETRPDGLDVQRYFLHRHAQFPNLPAVVVPSIHGDQWAFEAGRGDRITRFFVFGMAVLLMQYVEQRYC